MLFAFLRFAFIMPNTGGPPRDPGPSPGEPPQLEQPDDPSSGSSSVSSPSAKQPSAPVARIFTLPTWLLMDVMIASTQPASFVKVVIATLPWGEADQLTGWVGQLDEATRDERTSATREFASPHPFAK